MDAFGPYVEKCILAIYSKNLSHVISCDMRSLYGSFRILDRAMTKTFARGLLGYESS